MERRKLGKTDLELPVISYGASSLGQEFRRISIDEALKSCRVALDLGPARVEERGRHARTLVVGEPSARGFGAVQREERVVDWPRHQRVGATYCKRVGRHHSQTS